MGLSPWNPEARRARIKTIKALCGPKGLALDDGAYRAMLSTAVPGKTSCGDCSVLQLDAIINHLKRLAPTKAEAAEQGEWRFVFRCPADRQTYLRKIYRLAERCGPLMAPPAKVASKGYIEGIARQMLGASTALQFCSAETLHKIVQALEIHCTRSGV